MELKYGVHEELLYRYMFKMTSYCVYTKLGGRKNLNILHSSVGGLPCFKCYSNQHGFNMSTCRNVNFFVCKIGIYISNTDEFYKL